MESSLGHNVELHVMALPWEMFDVVFPDMWVALAGIDSNTVLFGFSFTRLPEFVVFLDLWASHLNAVPFVEDMGIFLHVAPFLCNICGRVTSWAISISFTPAIC